VFAVSLVVSRNVEFRGMKFSHGKRLNICAKLGRKSKCEIQWWQIAVNGCVCYGFCRLQLYEKINKIGFQLHLCFTATRKHCTRRTTSNWLVLYCDWFSSLYTGRQITDRPALSALQLLQFATLSIWISECVPVLIHTSAITLGPTVSSRPSSPLIAFLLCLRFSFGWTFTNYIYLLTCAYEMNICSWTLTVFKFYLMWWYFCWSDGIKGPVVHSFRSPSLDEDTWVWAAAGLVNDALSLVWCFDTVGWIAAKASCEKPVPATYLQNFSCGTTTPV